ncbi:MAG: hypothetical protein ACQEXJ_10095 [Myxococcota bacterium]
MRKLTILAAFGAAALFAFTGCDSDDGSDDGNGHGEPTPTTDEYEPFDQSNLQSQLLRVGAYETIQSIRKSDDFAAEDFGGSCDAWNPEAGSPSDATKIASNYVETASLAHKVETRADDHAYNEGAPIGEEIHASICEAIEAGSAVDPSTGTDAAHGIGWYGQVVDKALLHFSYLYVHHELVIGARKNWDEGFGQFGTSFDGTEAEGLAATTAARDDNCGTTYTQDIYDKLIEGRNLLDAALTDAGKDGNADALEEWPAELEALVEDVDRMMLEVFAISFAREFVGLLAGDAPAIKLIEGRMFFRILRPYLEKYDADHGTSFVADLEPQLEQDDPSQVDAQSMIDMVDTVFGIDVPALCN